MEQIFNTGHGLLADLWESLQRAIPPRLSAVDRLFNKFATSGWAFVNDIEDVLDALDSRLNFRRGDVLNFVKSLDIKLELICFSPHSRATTTSFFEGIRVEEAAHMLITLERLGFMTFPERLVDSILPVLKSRKLMMLTRYIWD
jgi:hypothetical protein